MILYLVFLSLQVSAEGKNSSQPHIIFILADDLVSICSKMNHTVGNSSLLLHTYQVTSSFFIVFFVTKN